MGNKTTIISEKYQTLSVDNSMPKCVKGFNNIA